MQPRRCTSAGPRSSANGTWPASCSCWRSWTGSCAADLAEQRAQADVPPAIDGRLRRAEPASGLLRGEALDECEDDVGEIGRTALEPARLDAAADERHHATADLVARLGLGRSGVEVGERSREHHRGQGVVVAHEPAVDGGGGPEGGGRVVAVSGGEQLGAEAGEALEEDGPDEPGLVAEEL